MTFVASMAVSLWASFANPPDSAKPWDEKISHEDRVEDGKSIHIFFC